MREPEGVFRFTEWLPSEGRCREWFQWFASRGIPAAIIRRDRNDGGPKFAVFRAGEEAGEELIAELRALDENNIVIVAQTDDFVLKWKEESV